MTERACPELPLRIRMLDCVKGPNSCRSQPLDVAQGSRAACPPEVQLALHVEPTVRRCAKGDGQPERHRGAYPGTAVEEFRKRLARNPERLGRSRNRYVEWFEAKLSKYFPGMRWIMHCHVLVTYNVSSYRSNELVLVI
jgi:hypothetical protein